MGKIVRLTESDLTRIVKRVLSEQPKDRWTWPSIKELDFLKGKNVNFKSAKNSKNYILKIERIYRPIGADSTTLTKNDTTNYEGNVILDCTVVNDYGEERGGILNTGVGNNINVVYNCFGQKEMGNAFKVTDSRFNFGTPQKEIGDGYLINDKLSYEIEQKFCLKRQKVPTQKMDY
jgi:hypothetical protein